MSVRPAALVLALAACGGAVPAQAGSGFAGLRRALVEADPAAREQRITAFLVGRPPADPDALRARLLLAGDQLRSFDLAAAAAGYRQVLTAAPAGERDLLARALYGLAQCEELRGRGAAAQVALDRLLREFRDIRHARFAAAARQRLRGLGRVQVGQLAPEFTARDLTGRVQSLASRRGAPVLLAFFALRDERSVRRVRDLVTVFEAAGGQTGNVLLFAVDGTPAGLQELAGRHGWRGPLLPCSGSFLEPVLLQYRVQVVPTAFLIGPDGVLLQRSPRPGALRRAMELLR